MTANDKSGSVVEVGPGIVRILAPNPSPFTLQGTNTYIISLKGYDGLIVLDPGPDNKEHLDLILKTASKKPIKCLLISHTHPDHHLGVPYLKKKTGATVLGHSNRDGLECDEFLKDNDLIELGSEKIQVLGTPGHATNHLCFFFPEKLALFSGDHVLGGSTTIIMPPDGDMVDYLSGLKRLEDLARSNTYLTLYPGHGEVVRNPIEYITNLTQHRYAREKKILEALSSGEKYGISELVPIVYVDTNSSLHELAKYSLWAHLIKLVQEKMVNAEDPKNIESKFWTKQDRNN